MTITSTTIKTSSIRPNIKNNFVCLFNIKTVQEKLDWDDVNLEREGEGRELAQGAARDCILGGRMDEFLIPLRDANRSTDLFLESIENYDIVLFLHADLPHVIQRRFLVQHDRAMSRSQLARLLWLHRNGLLLCDGKQQQR